MSGRLAFALGVLVALLISASALLVLRSRPVEPGAASRGPAATPDTAGPTRELGATIESTGRAPSFRLQFDPAGRGRLYSGGSVSDDWGRTWHSFVGPNGSSVVLLGGRRAVSFAFGPNGRLLLGEVLFETPGTPPGQGPIAHAVEWNGTAWDVLERVQASAPQAPPELRVRGVGYLPGGIATIALPQAIRFTGGIQRETPGEVQGFLAASDGTLYVAIEGRTQFPLYCASGMNEPWLPVGGVPKVTAMAEGSEGTVYLAAERLGRGRRGVVDWDPSGMEFVASHIVAHPRAPLLAAWGRESLLLLSRDSGRSFTKVRWSDLRVGWVAFDPGRTDSFLVVDRAGAIHRLSLAGEPAAAGESPRS